MTDNPDVERLNRIRAALTDEINECKADWVHRSLGERTGLKRALEIVERVWEPFYEGKSENRGAGPLPPETA